MQESQKTHTENITVCRRTRLLALLGIFVQAEVEAGVQPKGLEQAFAAKLQISPSLLSQIKKSRPISDKLARQIEHACGRSAGWLDQSEDMPDAGLDEKQFLRAAARAWRQADDKGRAALAVHVGWVPKHDRKKTAQI